MVDIVGSKEQYKRLLPSYPALTDRKIDETYGVVKEGDFIQVRLDE